MKRKGSTHLTESVGMGKTMAMIPNQWVQSDRKQRRLSSNPVSRLRQVLFQEQYLALFPAGQPWRLAGMKIYKGKEIHDNFFFFVFSCEGGQSCLLSQ